MYTSLTTDSTSTTHPARVLNSQCLIVYTRVSSTTTTSRTGTPTKFTRYARQPTLAQLDTHMRRSSPRGWCSACHRRSHSPAQPNTHARRRTRERVSCYSSSSWHNRRADGENTTCVRVLAWLSVVFSTVRALSTPRIQLTSPIQDPIRSRTSRTSTSRSSSSSRARARLEQWTAGLLHGLRRSRCTPSKTSSSSCPAYLLFTAPQPS